MPRNRRPQKGSSLEKYSMRVGYRWTSIQIEEAFYQGLARIARKRDISVPTLVASVDRYRGSVPRIVALRHFVLAFYQYEAMRARWRGNKKILYHLWTKMTKP